MKAFPSYTQLDAMDCVPTCLRNIAQYYGRHYSLQNLRKKCHITREGVSLLGISNAAELIGFRTTGAKVTWRQLRDEVQLPCIAHWNQQHFVVIYEIKNNVVYVSDPAAGLLEYDEAEFKKSWLQSYKEVRNKEIERKGIILILEPTPTEYSLMILLKINSIE